MDTITLQEALAGFTANESAALGSYIGLSSGGVGQKQSIAALAKVAGEQVGVSYISQTLAVGASITVSGYGFHTVVSSATSYSCMVQLRWQRVYITNETTGSKDIGIAMSGDYAFIVTNTGSAPTTVTIRKF